ncbi:DUF7009 family protein [Silvibacterium dinghuense]|uniref:Uncharacterized protein n=1 Tax=Silvibacterium dinghuense TaxID=1560006 RepID=A0A4Q1SAD1_9BACT|nr:hypothetical protein [Silvibacterium dinghuense]RXS93881.1 hypothetical protein ESZ00_17750 [Silvibacterium dinghuense]GGH08453.1 hypothetical protein GCM10011586_26020 [Silvibacterium dinghuense]
MKLRIKGNSIRLRIAVSEAAKLRAGEPVREIVRFAPQPEAFLAYALIPDASAPEMAVRYTAGQVTVHVPQPVIERWTGGREVGIYATLDIAPQGTLDVILEKDFACLDLSDAENVDTFPNPNAGAAC